MTTLATTSNPVHDLTPAALAAMGMIDPATATEFVQKFLEKAGHDPVAMGNLCASGLLGRPGQVWDIHIRDRVDAFFTFAWGDQGFESTAACQAAIRRWLEVAKPTPEDMSFLLFTLGNNDGPMLDFFLDAGADPHLPIIRNLANGNTQGKESYSTSLMVSCADHSLSPQLEKLLPLPADDLPLTWVSVTSGKYPSKTLLDIALTAGKFAAARAILESRDMRLPQIAKRMTDSLTSAIENDKHAWALRLLGVGAEPKGGNWEPVISFFSNPKPGHETPRILIDFTLEASDTSSLQRDGKPAVAFALERLAANGMDLNIRPAGGVSMVHLASHYGCLCTLKTLLECGAEFRDVLTSFDTSKPDGADLEPKERGRQILLTHAAHDAVSSVVEKTKAKMTAANMRGPI